LKPDWSNVVDAIGGGPIIVKSGKAVLRAGEAFGTPLLAPRQARVAIGQRADGRILLVAADGGRLGYSVGLSNYDMGRALAPLGAVTAYGLAPGAVVALASDGTLVTRAAAGGERPLSDALLLRSRAPGSRRT